MYYDRTISKDFEELLLSEGMLGWVIPYVKEREDLDLLIGKNNKVEYCSLYRGTSRLFKIVRTFSKSSKERKFKLEAADSYKALSSGLLKRGISGLNQKELEELLDKVERTEKFRRYYNNKKEGYYQNKISRKYGLLSTANSEFVVVDKEAVVGYKDQKEKDLIFTPIQKEYQELRAVLCNSDKSKYGDCNQVNKKGDVVPKSLGSELDLLAIDKEGNLILMELKHGGNTNGIYLSPFQIGLYYDVFVKYGVSNLFDSVISMLKQKQRLGLISQDWTLPTKVGKLKAWLVISENNEGSAAEKRYFEVVDFIDRTNVSLHKEIVVKNEVMKDIF